MPIHNGVYEESYNWPAGRGVVVGCLTLIGTAIPPLQELCHTHPSLEGLKTYLVLKGSPSAKDNTFSCRFNWNFLLLKWQKHEAG